MNEWLSEIILNFGCPAPRIREDEKQTHEVDFENSRKHPEDKIESIFFVIFVIFGYLSLTTNVINLAFSYRCEII